MPPGNNGNLTTVFSSKINVLEPKHRCTTTFLRGSPEELLRELRYQRKTGEIRILISQGGIGMIKWIETEKIT